VRDPPYSTAIRSSPTLNIARGCIRNAKQPLNTCKSKPRHWHGNGQAYAQDWRLTSLPLATQERRKLVPRVETLRLVRLYDVSRRLNLYSAAAAHVCTASRCSG
jgi:hypothetical protein